MMDKIHVHILVQTIRMGIREKGLEPECATLSPITTSGELAMKVWLTQTTFLQLVRQKNCQISH
jgi:hypothetical protein